MGFATVIDLLDASERPTYVAPSTSGREQLVESILRDMPNLAKRRFSNLTSPLIRTVAGTRVNTRLLGQSLFQVQPMPAKGDDDS